MAKTIKFNIKLSVDGKEQLAVATTSTKDLTAAMKGTQKGAKALRDQLLTLNQRIEFARNFADELKSVSGAIDSVQQKTRELQKSLSVAAQFSGLSGEALKEVRSQTQALADTFGGDFSDNIKAANSLSKSFGISMQDALKLMRDGFVSGANANGEFVDTLKEYPRYFKEAGISAEEFVAITTNAAKQGIFSDKGVDAIKEGNLRIREMTTATAAALDGIGISSERVKQQLIDGSATTFDIMREVGAKLKELPASASVVGTAIADIFGGPGEDAGLEYLKSLADIQLNMEAVKAQADDYSKALGDQADAQAKTNSVLLTFQDTIAGVVSRYNVLLTVFGGALQAAASVSLTFVSLTTVLNKYNVVSRLTSVVTKAWTAISKFATAANIALSGSEHAAAAGAIALKMALRGLMIATGVGAAIAALSLVVEALIGKFSEVPDSATQAAESMTSLQRITLQTSETFKNTLNNSLSDTMAKYKQLQEAWKSMKSDAERTKWIKDNASAFQELGLRVNDITSAENVFEKQTDNIVKAFNKRAEAAAHAAAMTELYKQKFAIQDRIDSRDAKANAKVPHEDFYKGQTIKHGSFEYNEFLKMVQKGVSVGKRKGKDGKEEDVKLSSADLKNGKKGEYILTDNAAKAFNRYVVNKPRENTSKWQAEDKASIKLIDKALKRHAEAMASATKEGNKWLDNPNTARSTTPSASTTSTHATNNTSNTSDVDTKEKKFLDTLKQEVVEAASVNEEIEGTTKSVRQLEDEISKLADKQKDATTAGEYDTLQEKIDKLKASLSSITGSDKAETEQKENPLQSYIDEVQRTFSLQGDARKRVIKDIGTEGFTSKIKELQHGLDMGDYAPEQIATVKALIMSYKDLRAEAATSFDTLLQGWDNVKGVGSSINSITDALDGQKSAWESITGVIDGFIQLVQSITAIIAIIDALSASLGNSKKSSNSAQEGAAGVGESLASTAVNATGTIIANTLLTKSNLKLAASEFFVANAMVPFADASIASGQVTQMAATMAAVNAIKLAKGGIVSGTTLALVGEYAGASHNPEVVAPLDKLRNMLQPQGMMGGEVKFRIAGDCLEGALANHTRIARKSGKRSNIKI